MEWKSRKLGLDLKWPMRRYSTFIGDLLKLRSSNFPGFYTVQLLNN
ncbi:hypothetical protein LEP1GSC171_2071 [Leptospira santarosai str. HAI1380]|nr:hypothetical protein LEP1GSC171_2071 [Leptospira santarosai str. HAI1380]